MRADQRVVDNRVFLLGLDELYRRAMARHECRELLTCAQRVAGVLGVAPADVPIEGYYATEPRLTSYFRLMRALQDVDERRTSEVAELPEFLRLRDVASAPLYGRPELIGKLLPVGRDPLTQALIDTQPDWSVEGLTAAAHTAVHATDDISLVGLAARIRDPVVLAALRESAVLYAMAVLGLERPEDRPQYVWQVDEDLAEQAKRFIRAFHELFGEELPPPDPTQAETYWDACDDNEIYGRCVRLGSNDATEPVRHYHWAIRGSSVHEFWHPEVWTTERYSGALRDGGPVPDL